MCIEEKAAADFIVLSRIQSVYANEKYESLELVVSVQWLKGIGFYIKVFQVAHF